MRMRIHVPRWSFSGPVLQRALASKAAALFPSFKRNSHKVSQLFFLYTKLETNHIIWLAMVIFKFTLSNKLNLKLF